MALINSEEDPKVQWTIYLIHGYMMHHHQVIFYIYIEIHYSSLSCDQGVRNNMHLVVVLWNTCLL